MPAVAAACEMCVIGEYSKWNAIDLINKGLWQPYVCVFVPRRTLYSSQIEWNIRQMVAVSLFKMSNDFRWKIDKQIEMDGNKVHSKMFLFQIILHLLSLCLFLPLNFIARIGYCPIWNLAWFSKAKWAIAMFALILWMIHLHTYACARATKITPSKTTRMHKMLRQMRCTNSKT